MVYCAKPYKRFSIALACSITDIGVLTISLLVFSKPWNFSPECWYTGFIFYPAELFDNFVNFCFIILFQKNCLTYLFYWHKRTRQRGRGTDPENCEVACANYKRKLYKKAWENIKKQEICKTMVENAKNM